MCGKAAFAGVDVQEAVSDHRSFRAERTAARTHAIHRVIGLRGIEISDDGAVLRRIPAQVAIDRARKYNAGNHAHSGRFDSAATLCAPAADPGGSLLMPDHLSIGNLQCAEAAVSAERLLQDR